MNDGPAREGRRPLTAILDEEPLGAQQRVIIVLCALVAMLDGFDTQGIALVAPAVAAYFHVSMLAFGLVFAVGLFGGLLGALLFGWAADRWGRRPSLIMAIALFAAGSLLTLWATRIGELWACRGITGLGLGGAMPGIIAMTAEYSPRRLRATLVTLMFCGFPLGAGVGALGITKLLAAYGWKVVFLAGGLMPLALLPVLIWRLPESIRWLALRGDRMTIERILIRMGRDHLWDGSLQLREEHTENARGSVRQLLASGRATGTVLLWMTFFCSLLLVYLLASWIPTIAAQAAGRPGVGTVAAAIANLSGIIGSIGMGRLIDRFGPFGVIGPAYLMGALVAAIVGFVTGLATSLYWFAAAMGIFCIGAQLCMVALASGFYPLALRATGIGWAMGIGRIGAILGPLLGGALVQDAGHYTGLFVVLVATSAGCGLAVLGMMWATARARGS